MLSLLRGTVSKIDNLVNYSGFMVFDLLGVLEHQISKMLKLYCHLKGGTINAKSWGTKSAW